MKMYLIILLIFMSFQIKIMIQNILCLTLLLNIKLYETSALLFNYNNIMVYLLYLIYIGYIDKNNILWYSKDGFIYKILLIKYIFSIFYIFLIYG